MIVKCLEHKGPFIKDVGIKISKNCNKEFGSPYLKNLSDSMA